MKLRPYQSEAIDALYDYLDEYDGHPAAVLPTGAGKTPVLATLAADVVSEGGRVAIVSHVKELLQQAADTIERWSPALRSRIGIHSAGLGRRDTDHACLVAGIQSVYKRACDVGPLDLIVVDEAHLIPERGDGMYRQFLADAMIVNPHVRVVGLTATPYRLKSGVIVGEGQVLDEIVYEANVRDLIEQGYLCRLVSKEGDETVATDGIRLQGGEFVEGAAAEAMRDVLESACAEIAELTADRLGTLIFAPGVAYAEEVAATLRGHGLTVGEVYGHTPKEERAETIEAFKSRRLCHLVNCEVLTTGFDATHVDCVALLRPTMSPGLYYQMCGRGLRLHDDKDECLILDFAGNVHRHGPLDDLLTPERKTAGQGGEQPMKTCPECKAIVPIRDRECICGYEFPIEDVDEPKHAAKAAALPVLSVPATVDWEDVVRVEYRRWDKRDDPSKPPTLRVDYWLNIRDRVSEWVCIEHEGYAYEKAYAWWSKRSRHDMPESVDEAVSLCRSGGVAEPSRVCVRRKTGEYPTITGHDLPEPPEIERSWGRPPAEVDEDGNVRDDLTGAIIPF